MAKIALTDISIKRLPIPEKGQTTYFDTMHSGFGIRVSQGGTKTFVVVLGKQRKWQTIGKYPAITLKNARTEARRLGLVHSSNPLERPSQTHTEAFASFLEDCANRIRPRTVSDYRRLISRHMDFGSKSLSSVTRSDILDRLDTLKHVQSERHHTFVATRAYLNWCVRAGIIPHSPIDRIAPTTATPARDRILDDNELRMIYHHAQNFRKPFGTLLQLLIHTGLRRSEVTNLHKDWVHGDVLEIPGAYTKNGHSHTLPLSEATLELIEPLPDQMFLSPRGVIFSNWGNSKKRFDTDIEIKPYRIHDLRRTFSSTHARLGTPIHVTEKLLNHVSGSISGVAATYNRYNYLIEMREALTLYEKHIKEITC